MKTPNQVAETKIFQGLVAFLGCGARCGAAALGELDAKSARTRAVEAVFGAKAAKWRPLAWISGGFGAESKAMERVSGAVATEMDNNGAVFRINSACFRLCRLAREPLSEIFTQIVK